MGGNISEQQRSDLGRVLSLINRFRLGQLRNEYVVPDNTVRRPREVGGKKKLDVVVLKNNINESLNILDINHK